MKRIRTKPPKTLPTLKRHTPPLSLDQLRIHNIDSIRCLTPEAKLIACKALIHDLLSWASLNPFEVVGIIESTKLNFILDIQDGKTLKDVQVEKESELGVLLKFPY